MAIELGLHSSSSYIALRGSKQAEERQRVFWTAYILEITLAYNLGRPPSISEEHITVALPKSLEGCATSTLHIHHRQIQHRLISRVYGANRRSLDIEAQAEITFLQRALDDWKTDLANLSDDTFTPYSHSYAFKHNIWFSSTDFHPATGFACITARHSFYTELAHSAQIRLSNQ